LIDTSRGFTISRVLDTTPEAIWRAWTDADDASVWWHPRGVSTPRETVTIDARVGGRYEYTMVNDSTGDRFPTVGEYREVVPLKKLVFTWGGPDDVPDDSPVITVTIESLGELTRLTLDVRGVDGMRGDADVYDGWDSALDVLVEHLGQHEVFG
jgi:uncharacterized protein YndB with AHSA1/START domain